MEQQPESEYIVIKALSDNVDLVQSRKTHQRYAMKKVKRSSLAIIRLKKLDHCNIVRYIEEISDEKQGYQVLREYCAGGDLETKLETMKTDHTIFAEEEILKIFANLAQGLQYLHSKDIYHGDLNPKTIVFDSSEIAKLGGDFGSPPTKAMKEDMYYLCYSCPELLKSNRFDYPCDIWSLGCVIYELCEMRVPYLEWDAKKLKEKIFDHSISHDPISEHYSSELSDLINKMLRKDPKERPNIDQIVSADILKKYLTEKQKTVRRASSLFVTSKKEAEEKNSEEENSSKTCPHCNKSNCITSTKELAGIIAKQALAYIALSKAKEAAFTKFSNNLSQLDAMKKKDIERMIQFQQDKIQNAKAHAVQELLNLITDESEKRKAEEILQKDPEFELSQISRLRETRRIDSQQSVTMLRQKNVEARKELDQFANEKTLKELTSTVKVLLSTVQSVTLSSGDMILVKGIEKVKPKEEVVWCNECGNEINGE